MIKVVGIQEKSGEYKGSPYHNVMIQTVDDGANYKDCLGEYTDKVKVKFAKVASVFGHSMSPTDWQELIGKRIRVFYDAFGNVEAVEVIKDNKA